MRPASSKPKTKAPASSNCARSAAEGLQDIYFRDRGRRAAGLEVEFADIDYIDFEL